MGILDRILRAGEGKKLKALEGLVPDINARSAEMAALSDDALRGKTAEFRSRIDRGESLDDLLVEAFAVMREAANRVIGQRHFDVQLMGGAALHFGWVAEMKTGEGKTLVSTLPAYLNGLSGKGVHVITVNDYLARFHAEWMGRIHNWMGLEVGLVVPGFKSVRPRSVTATRPTSPTAPTTSSGSTTCATTWPARWPTRCSAATTTPSSTRSTRSSSTRPAPRSSSAAAWPTPPSSTTASPASCAACAAMWTTRWRKTSAWWCRWKPASRRSSRRWASRTCTTRCSRTWCTRCPWR
jgi:hypothetical protein